VDLTWVYTYKTFNFRAFKTHNRERFETLRVLSDCYPRRGTGIDSHTHNDIKALRIP